MFVYDNTGTEDPNEGHNSHLLEMRRIYIFSFPSLIPNYYEAFHNLTIIISNGGCYYKFNIFGLF